MKKYSLTIHQSNDDDKIIIDKIIIKGIGNDYKYEGNIEGLFKISGRITVENLEISGYTIIYYLLNNGYSEIDDDKLSDKNFSTLINDNLDFYNIKIKTGKKTITIENLKKKIGSNLSSFKKNMNIENYDDNDSIEFAIKLLENYGIDNITIGSSCVKEFKRIGYCHSSLCKIDDDEEEFVRKSYRGGMCGLKEGEYEGDIISLDMNSMYPYVMKKYQFPNRKGEKIYGKQENGIYIQHVILTAKLKKGHMPCISTKNKFLDIDHIYVCFEEDLILTSVDIENVKSEYDIENIEYLEGYRYKYSSGIFDKYINKWYSNKIKSKKEGNESLYYISKLMLNNLSGKLATNRNGNKVKFKIDNNGEFITNSIPIKIDDFYLPAACFINAYARRELIEARKKIGGELLYWDTDSLHIRNYNIENINIDEYKLGYWKIENVSSKGIYLKQKVYSEYYNEKWNYTISGISNTDKENVNENNFKIGNVIDTIIIKRIKGGCIKIKSKYTI